METPLLVSVWVAFGAVFDILIGLAYFSIPCSLVILLLRQDCSNPLRRIFLFFAIFILSCGMVHLITPLSVHHEGFLHILISIKFITVVASIFTSAMLFVKAAELRECTTTPHSLQILLSELQCHKDNLNATVNIRTAELQVEKARWQSICEKTPQILWLTSPRGDVEYYNHKWFSYTGAPADGNADWDKFMDPADRVVVKEQLARHYELGESWVTKGRLRRADGEYRWHHISAVPIRDPQHNTIIQWCAVAVDIHDSEVVTQLCNEDIKRKKQFLAMVSHEMRTPLNGILGMATLLGDTQLQPSQQDTLKNVTLCAEQLLGLVNNILDLFKLQNDKMMVLDLSLFNLNELVQDAFAAVSAQAASKDITIKCNFNTNIPSSIKGDYARVRQVLVNLLSNAVKFTPTSGAIHVAAEMRTQDCKSMLCFSIKDNGIGISSDNLPKLFEMFSQVDSSSTRKFGGTGLGLAISKALVERMHGSIWCESTLGEGTTFYFTIEAVDTPVMCPPSPIVHPIEILPVPHPPSLNLNISGELCKEQSSPRILVVDDTSINLKVVKRMLEGLGFSDLVLAEDGAIALEKVQSSPTPFDIVLMDMEMPVMDGMTAATHIRNLPLLKQPHIVAVTANAFQEDVKRCVDSGMCGHMAKPVKKEGIKFAVEEYMYSIASGTKGCKCKGCDSTSVPTPRCTTTTATTTTTITTTTTTRTTIS